MRGVSLKIETSFNWSYTGAMSLKRSCLDALGGLLERITRNIREMMMMMMGRRAVLCPLPLFLSVVAVAFLVLATLLEEGRGRGRDASKILNAVSFVSVVVVVCLWRMWSSSSNAFLKS